MQHLVSYGIAGNTVCNVVGMTSDRSAEGREYSGPWVTECSGDEIRACFAGWEPELQEILKVRRLTVSETSQ